MAAGATTNSTGSVMSGTCRFMNFSNSYFSSKPQNFQKVPKGETMALPEFCGAAGPSESKNG